MPNETKTEDLQLESTSGKFIGQWINLVSTTNWEKGKIILLWREAFMETSAESSEYSDEAWALRVGGITGQHVGRLRRVAERFEESRNSYEGLFWSHFQAALDWEDAEMWLEGALQNKWSVSKMKNQRWEAIGAPNDKKPNDADIITSELNEDIDADEFPEEQTPSEIRPQTSDIKSNANDTITDETDSEEESSETDSDPLEAKSVNQAATLTQPFANLPKLPSDVQEAFDLFKLAILQHKTGNWEEISSNDLLASLDALKSLITAPTSEESTAV